MTAKPTRPAYHAFISYSHRGDGRLAPALQSALNRFARPWYRLRWMSVFRDDTDLAINPHLWSSIEDALRQSEYFVLLASPQAAESEWVAREVGYWRANRSIDKLLIVLTDGEIAWDQRAHDFNWQMTTALPRSLSGAFSDVPLYADLRAFRNASELSNSNPAFLSEVAKVAATIHGRPLREIFGEEARQRRFRKLAVTGIVLVLMAATLIAVWNAIAANRSARQARSRELAVASRIERDSNPDLSIVLADRAVRISPTSEATAALQAALRGSPLRNVLSGDSKALVDAVFAPDGRRVVTGGLDGIARIWDSETGDLLVTLTGHSSGINTVRISAEGSRILAGSEDGSARVWDATSGRVVCTVQHAKGVRDAELSADGRRIVTASMDHTARVSDTDTCATVVELRAHRSGVARASFSTDGQRILTVGFDDTALIWNTGTGTVIATLRHFGANFAILSPDASRAVTAGLDDSPILWNATTGAPVAHLGAFRLGGNRAAFSFDGKRVLVSGVEPAARVWDAESGAMLAEWRRPDDLDPNDAANPGEPGSAFSRDGHRAITWVGSTIRLWDADTGREMTLFARHTGKITAASFSPDGTQVISASFDGTARIWRATAARIRTRIEDRGRTIEHAAFSADGRSIAIATREDGVRVWNIGTPAPSQVLRSADRMFQEVGFSPDGQRIVAETVPYAQIWDRISGKSVRLASPSVVEAVGSPQFSPDGTLVVAASATGARMWDAGNGRLLKEFQGHTDAVTSAVFSGDGARIVTASRDGTARVWDVTSGRLVQILSGHTAPLSHAAFNADGTRIITASYDHTARVWDVQSAYGVAVLTHTLPVDDAIFSSDGRWIATVDQDRTVRVWDAFAGQELERFSSGNDYVKAITFFPGKSTVAALTVGGNVMDIECELCVTPDRLLRLASRRVFKKPSAEDVRRYRLNEDGLNEE